MSPCSPWIRRIFWMRLIVEEVEAHETVFDPLGAAPNLLFGRLHAAWRAFVDGRAEDGDLCSFSAAGV